MDNNDHTHSIRAAEEVDKARISRQEDYRKRAIERQEAIAKAHKLKNEGLDVKAISVEMKFPQSFVRSLLKQDPPERRYPILVRDDTHASIIAGEIVRRHDSIKIEMVLDTTEGGQFYMLGAALDLDLINAFKFEPIAVDWVADAATTSVVTGDLGYSEHPLEDIDPNRNSNVYEPDHVSEEVTPDV